MSARAKLLLIGVAVIFGSFASLRLALASSKPLLIAAPFVTAGLIAAFIARSISPGTKSEALNSAKADPEWAVARRKRQQDIYAATATLRSQVIYGLVGVTLLLVGGPAGVLVALKLYAIAFPVGICFLVLLWFHWLSAWKYHRTIPGMIGVSTTWPTGYLSPADRRFLSALLISGSLWYASLTLLALAARSLGQVVIMLATLLALGVPLLWVVRTMWRRVP